MPLCSLPLARKAAEREIKKSKAGRKGKNRKIKRRTPHEHHTRNFRSVAKGNAPKVKALVGQALAENLPAGDILNDGLIAGMMEIGQKFKENKVYVPEVLIAARAMNAGLEVLKPGSRRRASSP